jgi:hypothetical protein
MRVVIGCLVLWNVIGLFLFGISSNLGEILSIWRLNPIEVYKYFKVNYFGCFWLTLFFNLMCPVLSLCYWFYKACTVGRKQE